VSRVTEIADEEARRAEAETPDVDEAAEEEETPPEEETPSEPEPAPELEGLSDEERVKRLGQAVNRFERALQKLFGLEEPLQEVPMEGAIGFMLPGVLEMREHEDFRRCPTCNGHGRVLTGSVHEGDQTADCPNPNCRGRGYWRRHSPRPRRPSHRRTGLRTSGSSRLGSVTHRSVRSSPLRSRGSSREAGHPHDRVLGHRRDRRRLADRCRERLAPAPLRGRSDSRLGCRLRARSRPREAAGAEALGARLGTVPAHVHARRLEARPGGAAPGAGADAAVGDDPGDVDFEFAVVGVDADGEDAGLVPHRS
jgi:hypothetical protein